MATRDQRCRILQVDLYPNSLVQPRQARHICAHINSDDSMICTASCSRCTWGYGCIPKWITWVGVNSLLLFLGGSIYTWYIWWYSAVRVGVDGVLLLVHGWVKYMYERLELQAGSSFIAPKFLQCPMSTLFWEIDPEVLDTCEKTPLRNCWTIFIYFC